MTSVQHVILWLKTSHVLCVVHRKELFLSTLCILAFFEVLTRALTMQGCGKLTDFVHFSAFPQCLAVIITI